MCVEFGRRDRPHLVAPPVFSWERKEHMPNRKELKRSARQALKRNYIMFVLVCLIASFIGAKNAYSLTAFELQFTPGLAEADADLDQVWGDIVEGDLQQGAADSQSALSNIQKKDDHPYLGRSRGVLAQVVNSITSGSALMTLTNAVTSVVKSPNIATTVLVGLSAVLTELIWFLIVNVYSVISARLFLEGRLYSRLPVVRFVFLLRVRKWLHAAWVMLFESILLMLWSLTIVGGLIKRYSYAMVPYIVAENPTVSARQAVTLSRNMMRGHKWECFLLELSFLGWGILSILTFFAPLGIFFLNPYREAAMAEYYAQLRTLAQENHLPGSELLNDEYLYVCASEATLHDAYAAELSLLARPVPESMRKPGLAGLLNRLFGVTLVYDAADAAHNEYLEQKAELDSLEHILNGQEYPTRLFPIPEHTKRRRVKYLHYMRHYSLLSLVSMFFIFSFIGWVWEVSLHLITDGEFVNRGVMFGPWLPIYGSGGLLILILLNKFRSKPLVEFFAAVVLCGGVEYFTSWFLEVTHDGMKWWDYSGYFLNLNGRICAEGLLVFGLGGIAIVYLIAPLLDNLLRRVRVRHLAVVCALLVTAFAVDHFYSSKHPNTGKGITDYAANTRELPAQPLMLRYGDMRYGVK